MKKLKIFLPILLISLFFIPKVNASTLLDGKLKIEYGDNIIQNVNDYSERLNNLKTYLQTTNRFGWNSSTYTYIDSGKYVVRIQNMDTNTWKVWLLSASQNGNYIKTTYNQYTKQVYYYIGYYLNFDVSFNGNNVTGHSNQSYGSTGITWNVPSDCDITTGDCVVESTGSYYDTTFYTDIGSVPFNSCTGTCSDFSFKVGNTTYSPGDNINPKELFDDLMPNLNPYKCTVEADGFDTSSLSNISDFEYRITAENLSSQDYGIEGSFAFQNSSFTFSDNNFDSADYWEAQIIKGPNSVGEYNVNGVFSWDNTTKVLTINYGVYATGSEPAKVDAIIKIIPKSQYSEDYFGGTLNYYSCYPINPNISFVDSYGYTDNTTGLSNSYDTSLMNFLNSSSNPDLQFFNNIKTLLPTGPVDSILTIPLQMLNSINNFLGSNCTPLTLNLPYVNRNVELKCIRSFYTDIGATTWVESVGAVASVILLVNYFTYLYNWVEDVFRLSHKNLKTWGTGEL